MTTNPVLVCLADVPHEHIDWLWLKRIARGKLTLVVGDPGVGKSLLTTDLAARVSVGNSFPDGTPCPVGSVFLISAEDGLADTVKHRLDRAGADTRNVLALTSVSRTDAEGKVRE